LFRHSVAVQNHPQGGSLPAAFPQRQARKPAQSLDSGAKELDAATVVQDSRLENLMEKGKLYGNSDKDKMDDGGGLSAGVQL
jgi:hypothetical protein